MLNERISYWYSSAEWSWRRWWCSLVLLCLVELILHSSECNCSPSLHTKKTQMHLIIKLQNEWDQAPEWTESSPCRCHYRQSGTPIMPQHSLAGRRRILSLLAVRLMLAKERKERKDMSKKGKENRWEKRRKIKERKEQDRKGKGNTGEERKNSGEERCKKEKGRQDKERKKERKGKTGMEKRRREIKGK